jgi:hypothetical protein
MLQPLDAAGQQQRQRPAHHATQEQCGQQQQRYVCSCLCAHQHQTDGTSMPCTQCCPTQPVDGSQCQERLLISSAPFRCGHGHVQDTCSLLGASKAPLLRMAWLLSSCSAGTRGAGPATGARLQHCHADKNCTSVTAADTRALHPGLTPTCISARVYTAPCLS